MYLHSLVARSFFCCTVCLSSRPHPTTTSLTIPSTRTCRTHPVEEAQDMRHFAFASRSLATWPSQMQAQVMSPKRFDKITSVDNDTTFNNEPISPTSRKPPTRATDKSVIPQCLNPLFCTFLMMILLFRKKARKACNRETVARQCECCRIDVKERLTEQLQCESEESQKILF